MSTLEPKSIAKTTLPQFKSTNTIHPRTKLTPTKHKSQHSAFFTPMLKYSSDNDSGLLSKTLLQTNLPDIHSKKSVQKRSSIMEMWLDEALDPQEKHISSQNPPLRVDVDKTGPLRTVQKFEIDKKYLKSQNMSPETIDKIYNSLYVYTYGINHSFKEILSLTKMSQHTQKKIIDNFWKTYIRLLEGCTSFQTTFQIIQEGHLKAKAELKNTFIKREQEWQKERSALEEENIKLLKKIGEQSLTLSKLTTDYNISQTTLLLTDKAFNDEVNIRLMFEEKVNSMFNSYDQLRCKYEELLITLRIKEEEGQQTRKRDEKLRYDSKILQIRNDDLQKQISLAQQHLSQREKELTLKRQQIFELNNVKHQLIQQKQSQEEQIRKIVLKIDHFRQLSQQFKIESKSKGIIITELQKRLQQQDKALSANLQTENKLYQQLSDNSQLISSLKKSEIQLGLNLKETKENKDRFKQVIQRQETNIEELNSKINQLQKTLNDTQGELTIKNGLIQKNTTVLVELQAVNGKLEKMLKHVSSEKAKMEQELSSSLEISERFKEEMEGMKMLLQSKTVQMEQAQVKLENEREVFRSKIAGLKEQISVRDHKILEMHNQEMQGKQKVKEAEEELADHQEKKEQMKNQMLNLEAEIVQLKIKVEAVEKQRTKISSSLRNAEKLLQGTQQELKTIKQALFAKETLICSAQQNSKSESQQLRSLLQNYRQDRQRKISYIHPMLYEDAKEQINRLTLNKQELLEELQRKKESISILQEKLGQRRNLQQQAEQTKRKATKMIIQNEEKITLLKQNQRRLEVQLQQAQKRCTNSNQIKEKISIIEVQRQRLKEQLNQKQKQLQQKSVIILRQKQILSDNNMAKSQLQQKLYHVRQELEEKNQQISSIKQKNRVLTSRESEREKLISSESKKRQDDTLKSNKKESELIHQETQTEKKFNHSFKFQLAQTSNSFGCQVEDKDLDIVNTEERIGREREPKKVEAHEFRRALKITYMRR